MNTRRIHPGRAAAALAAILAFAVLSAAQTQPSSAQSSQAPAKSTTLQVSTRLVTVDVVATDSHGKPIRDLKPGDFVVTDGGRQTIEKFTFIDKPAASASASSAAPAPARGFYTNQLGVDTLAAPPTVILVDSLNTATGDLVQMRRHMLDLLKTLPANTPVAVLLLGNALHMVQNFTTDPSLLRAAIDSAGKSPSVISQMPQDDHNSLSLLQTEANDNQENEDIQLLENFEKETYANQMDIRAATTLNALRAIARYLNAYQGRKNLVWVSESFPLALWPDTDFGTNTGSAYPNSFAGTRAYNDQIQETANALTDARVAVYPVDARGLDTNVIPAAQVTVSVPGSRSRNPSAQLRRIIVTRMMSQSSMDQLAESTGGKTCKNTNDLGGCIETAIGDSSAYYEIGYNPAGIKWDGRFRKISLKVNRSGVKLAYRRGYYALDEQPGLSKVSPEDRLRSACQDFLPSTAFPLSAKAIPPSESNGLAYEVTMPAGAFTVAPSGGSYKISAMLASCVFPPAGDTFTFATHDLTQTLSASEYAGFQAHGLRGPAHYLAQNASRIRVAVLDEPSGAVASLDIPVRPHDFDSLVPITATAPPAAPPQPPSPNPPSAKPSTSIAFHLPSGESAALDWTGNKLVYAGEIPAATAVPAFFEQFYTSRGFHCSSGALMPDDPSAPPPTLRLVFTNSSGAALTVELKGGQPEYSGTLGIDPSARPFFTELWSLAHCQAAP